MQTFCCNVNSIFLSHLRKEECYGGSRSVFFNSLPNWLVVVSFAFNLDIMIIHLHSENSLMNWLNDILIVSPEIMPNNDTCYDLSPILTPF